MSDNIQKQPDDVGEPPKKKPKEGRIKWPKIEIEDLDGNLIHPFLSPTNWKDQAFVQLMLDMQPFNAKFGLVGDAWEKAKDAMGKATIPIHARESPDDPGLVFHKSMNAKTMKQRLGAIISWMKKHNGKIPLKSGVQDEETPTQFIQNLLDLFEVYTARNESDGEDEKDEWAGTTKKGANAESNANDIGGITKLVSPSIHNTDSQRPNPLSRAISKLGEAIIRVGLALETANLNNLQTEKFKMKVEQLNQDSSSKAFGLYSERIREVEDEIKRVMISRDK